MKNFLLAIFVLLISAPSFAQKKQRNGEFYFSWGYNKEWYTHSNIRVMQPELGNDFKFVGVKAHDHPGWDEGLLHLALSIPQYNYRIGYFFNKKKNLAFELNFDHTKYIFADQKARIQGKLENRQVDTLIDFSEANGFNYFLNNGANFLLFNIVKRSNYYTSNSLNFKLDGLCKVGIGPVIPHVENTFFGKKNDAGFQLGGWNVGVEYALRATFFKFVYLEFCNKLDYAGYSNLKVYKGTARQLFGTYEMILNLGITFPTGKLSK